LGDANSVAVDSDVGFLQRLNEVDDEPDGLCRADDMILLDTGVRASSGQKILGLGLDDGSEPFGAVVAKRLVISSAGANEPRLD
jgi:hypothetical protein